MNTQSGQEPWRCADIPKVSRSHFFPRANQPRRHWRGLGVFTNALLSTALLATSLIVNVLGQTPTPSQAAGLSQPTQVANSDDATCAVNNEGKIFCWGDNTYGQLGNGNNTSSAAPVLTSNPPSEGSKVYTKLVAGASHFCALSGTDIYCWGKGWMGQLGNGSASSNLNVPTKVLGNNAFSTLAAGANHTCAIGTDTKTYCWGDQHFYQIGNGVQSDTTPQTAPVALTMPNNEELSSIEAGGETTCGIRSSDGLMVCWGLNSHGQTNNVAGTMESDPDADPPTVVNATKTPARTASTIVWKPGSLTGGGRHFCGIQASDNAVYCWGGGYTGQLGDSTWTNSAVVKATKLADTSALHATQVRAWYNGTCAIALTTSRLHCWGGNDSNQWGNGTTTGANVATPIMNGRVYRTLAVSSPKASMCAFEVANDGLYCWGRNDKSQAAPGTTNMATPTQHAFASARAPNGVTQLRADGTTRLGIGLTTTTPKFSAVLTTLDSANDTSLSLCIEAKPIGTAFNGTNTQCSAPVSNNGTATVSLDGLTAGNYHWQYQVQSAKYGYSTYRYFGGNGEIDADFVVGTSDQATTDMAQSWQSATSNRTMCALNHEGVVYCTGDNSLMQFGVASPASSSTPVKRDDGRAYQSITAGNYHTCALSNGNAYCWGSTDYGQGGSVASSTPQSPTLVTGNHTFTSLTAGEYITCGIDTDGATWCWGRGSRAALGNDSTSPINQPVPQRVLANAPFVQIAAGNDTVCGRSASNEISCWGYNNFGQAGSGTIGTNVTVATPLSSGTTMLSVSGGATHFCGLRASDSAVMCWGEGTDMKLGNGSTANSLTPVNAIRSDNSQNLIGTSVNVFANSSCALITGGQLWCWGAGSLGQMANGSASTPSNPTARAGLQQFSRIFTNPTAFYACARDANSGDPICWGSNDYNAVSPSAGFQAPTQHRFLSSDVATSPQLYATNGTTSLGVGGTTVTPVIKATMSTLDTTNDTQLQLCVDVAPVGTPFNGAFAYCSTAVANGAQATVSLTGLSVGSYHFRYRTQSTYYGYNTSHTWGVNAESTADLNVAASEPASSLSQPLQVANAAESTCALSAEGKLFCWGQGTVGALATGSNTSSTNPAAAVAAADGTNTYSAITASKDNAFCAISNGLAYCWGNNADAQVGNGSSTSGSMNIPTKVAGDHQFVSITGGYSHFCGLDTGGDAWCWGRQDFYNLGNNTTSTTGNPTPQKVQSPVSFTAVVAGGDFTCGLSADGTPYCWGMNDYGQLANGSAESPLGANTVVTANKTALPITTSSMKFTQLSLGQFHACGLETGTNRAYCWGRGDWDQLGNGTTTTSYSPQPVYLDGGTTQLAFTEITASSNTTCGRTVDFNELYCWGVNDQGEYANNATTRTSKAQAAAPGYAFRTIGVAKGNTFCAIREADERLSCWGQNDYNQASPADTTNKLSAVMHPFASHRTTLFPKQFRGDGTTPLSPSGIATSAIMKATPTSSDPADTSLSWCIETKPLDTPFDSTGGACSNVAGIGTETSIPVTTLGVGKYHWRYRVVSSRYGAGAWTSWGFNNEGEADITIATDEGGPYVAQWAQVVGGATSTCALNREGRAYCWGNNDNGNLGNGNTTASETPVAVLGDHKFSQISGGDYHYCGLEGTQVWCWGWNQWGQVGDGTHAQNSYATPNLVVGSNEFVAVSVGGWASCGLLSNMTVKCWGENSLYQHGTGTAAITAFPTPESLNTVTPFVQLRFGEDTSCARDGANRIWCWGNNSHGQVGNGLNNGGNAIASANDNYVPRQVLGNRTYSGLSLGYRHTCAIETVTNNVWCWGHNGFGELGMGSLTPGLSGTPLRSIMSSTSSPVVAGDIVASAFDSCIRPPGGNFTTCWGENQDAKLGLGDVLPTNSPSAITAFGGETFRSLMLGPAAWHFCGYTTSSDDMKCWGNNESSQTAPGTTRQVSPVQHTFLSADTTAPPQQFKNGDGTALATGGVGISTMQFKATMTTLLAGDTVALCVEIKPVGTAFTGTNLDCSTPVTNGNVATVTRTGLAEGRYHWRYTNSSAHGYANFATYGGNAESATDFVIDTTAPSLSNMSQRKLDGETLLPTGAITTETAVVARATVSDAVGRVRVCVEFKRVFVDFDGSGEVCSALVDSGQYAYATMNIPGPEGYHWRARAMDEAGNTSAWFSYEGAYYEHDADFAYGVSRPSVSALTQVAHTGGATIPTGGYINATTAGGVDLGATVTLNSGTWGQLCVELKDSTQSFVNATGSCTSVTSGDGARAYTFTSGLTNGMSYKWQIVGRNNYGLYSEPWTPFNSGNTAFTVDTVGPVAGAVYDGSAAGVQQNFNDGSYDVLDANWAGFADAIQPVGNLTYEYAIGRAPGGVDVRGWTGVASATSVHATGLTGLHTGELYYVSVRATDAAGNVSAIASSQGQQLAPMLSLTPGQTSVDFGELNLANSFISERSASFSVTTNGYNGYELSASLPNAFASGSSTIAYGTAMATATKANPGVGLHVTSPDSLVAGLNPFQPATCPGDGTARPAHGCWASLGTSVIRTVDYENHATATTPIVGDTTTLWFRLQADALQPAGSYATSMTVAAWARY